MTIYLYVSLNHDADPQKPSQDTLLPGTTYWFNEYLHVGHVPYNIGLIQVPIYQWIILC